MKPRTHPRRGRTWTQNGLVLLLLVSIAVLASCGPQPETIRGQDCQALVFQDGSYMITAGPEATNQNVRDLTVRAQTYKAEP